MGNNGSAEFDLFMEGDLDIFFDMGTQTEVSGDYNKLINKPAIESIVLEGDKPLATWVDGITPQDIDQILYG